MLSVVCSRFLSCQLTKFAACCVDVLDLMTMSDSGGDSDCFESADEYLSEEDVSTPNNHSRLNSSELFSENEPENSVASYGSTESASVSEDSNIEISRNTSISDQSSLPAKSTQYRKRPERSKKPANSSKSETKVKDNILKTASIKSDAIINDITDHISKNLNIGLSTIHQTSSSIKDLVLNSFPIENSSDLVKTFSYDDRPKTSSSTMQIPSNMASSVENVTPDLLTQPSLDEMITTMSKEFNMLQNITEHGVMKSVEGTYQGEDIQQSAAFDYVGGDADENLDNEVDKNSIDLGNEVNPLGHPEPENSDHLSNVQLESNNNNGNNNKEAEAISTYTEDKVETKNSTYLSEKVSLEVVHNLNSTKESGWDDFDVKFSENPVESVQCNTNYEALKENVPKDVLVDSTSKLNDSAEVEDVEGWDDFNINDEELETLDNRTVTSSVEPVSTAAVNSESWKARADEKAAYIAPPDTAEDVRNVAWDDWADEGTVGTAAPDNGVYVPHEKATVISQLDSGKDAGNESWDDWGDEGTKTVVESDSLKAPDHELDGWDDWVDEGTTDTVQPNTEGCVADESWGDWTDQKKSRNTAQHNPISTVDSDMWGDWNDDETEKTETEQKKVPDESGISERNSSEDKESSGKWIQWEDFGQKQQPSWGLKKWGVSALINTATAVTSNISAVSQGLSSVLEAGLGVPDPESFARMRKAEVCETPDKPNELTGKKSSKPSGQRNVNSDISVDRENDDLSSSSRSTFPAFGITNLVAGVTSKIVEHSKVHEIGSKVITGGLDTLENIGRKTMEALQEGDPGLKKKRALLLGGGKPVLSHILREAKEKAETQDKKLEEKEIARNCHFEILFDEFHGLVHLEALEMLSVQCELKLEQMKNSFSGEDLDEFLGTLTEVKELCEIDEDDFESDFSGPCGFKTALTEAVQPLKDEILIDRMVDVCDNVYNWFEGEKVMHSSHQVVFQRAISTLAELTAATAQQFHKGGERLMVKEHRKTVEEVDTLLQLTSILCTEVNALSISFLTAITESRRGQLGSGDADLSVMMTNISLEAKNATSYIKQAFNLLIPVLQLGAT